MYTIIVYHIIHIYGNIHYTYRYMIYYYYYYIHMYMEHEWTEMMIDHQILGHHQFSAAGLKGRKNGCLIPSLYCLDKPTSSNFLVRSWPPVHAISLHMFAWLSCRTSKLVTDSNDSKHVFPHYIPFHLQIVSPKTIIHQFPLEFSTFFPYITRHSPIFSYKPTTFCSYFHRECQAAGGWGDFVTLFLLSLLGIVDVYWL